MKVLALTLLCLLIAANEAKIFTKCELAKVMKQDRMDGYHDYSLGNWICMAYHESRFNTTAVGPRNTDGSHNYGIFQINSRYWCTDGQGPSANGCRASCSNFTTDDISDDIECIKRIVQEPQGMDARVAWRKNCKGKNLSSWTSNCGV